MCATLPDQQTTQQDLAPDLLYEEPDLHTIKDFPHLVTFMSFKDVHLCTLHLWDVSRAKTSAHSGAMRYSSNKTGGTLQGCGVPGKIQAVSCIFER